MKKANRDPMPRPVKHLYYIDNDKYHRDILNKLKKTEQKNTYDFIWSIFLFRDLLLFQRN